MDNIHEIIEIVASHLDAKDQLSEGIPPEKINHERWKDRYRGTSNSPDIHHGIIKNQFKPEVDMLVAKILNTQR